MHYEKGLLQKQANPAIVQQSLFLSHTMIFPPALLCSLLFCGFLLLKYKKLADDIIPDHNQRRYKYLGKSLVNMQNVYHQNHHHSVQRPGGKSAAGKLQKFLPDIRLMALKYKFTVHQPPMK